MPRLARITLGIRITPHIIRPRQPIHIKVYPGSLPWFAHWVEYTFTSDAGAIHKSRWSRRRAYIDTVGLKPGTYTVKAHVECGYLPWQQADAVGTFMVTLA